MAGTSSASAKPEMIDLTKLSPDQLMQIKQEFEQEMGNIQESLSTLHGCKAKYAGSKEALETFQPDWENRQILVPLTSSMYVPGRVKDLNNFVIDIGTGYYIEKDLEGSKDYFKRRVEYVQEQIEKIEKIHLQKTRFLNSVVGVLEMKQAAAVKMMQAQQQQQQSNQSA
ncbi:GL24222 [Drosophila persimilis]|uniref:GL24222 n=2 Tax=pseudoobscura subgroup TaxID=32358 RepID=B4G4P8_DROPE|nr:probable prefoldin subunit 5 [Drosophila pseudoobscura]XP_002013578.1 probable prefoldin subunit 5 [Drosophila persimilis]XP_022215205.1 probable prefoldin subunit 5 [Drosophila obscura]EDW24564.1 GL24222 [Drosophila persimilis]